MYIFKNAVKNIGRNKGRNILMAVIIFAIILTTAVSIIINTTTGAIIKDYKARFGAEVSITYDFNKAISTTQYTVLTPEQQVAFGESEYLQNKKFDASMQIAFENLRALDDDKEGLKMGGSLNTDSSANSDSSETVKILGKIVASNQSDISDDFKKEFRKIISGNVYSAKDECIVSEQFAKFNKISVGDTIVVKSFYKNKPMPHTLKISGIYSDYTMTEGSIPSMYEYFPSAASNRNNEILVSFDTAKAMKMASEPNYLYVDAAYFLKDPAMLKDFQNELTKKGLPDTYKVTTDETGYNKIVGPVEGLSNTTKTFLLAVLILGSSILILLSTLAIRERKYEIGVLRAMGMKKGKVALGLLSEMLVITALCLVLGLGVGSVVSQPVANSMLSNQIELAENNQSNGGGMVIATPIGGNTDDDETPLSELEANLNIHAVIQIILISLALAGVSSIVGILYITKYEPMKILSERN
ncbi:MAG: ABC transporter permease [Acetanaerobacterium sp.]